MNHAATRPLLTVQLRDQRDVVQARKRGRQMATLAGIGLLDQTRFATAVSEIARNAVEYGGGGVARFSLASQPPALLVEIIDQGTGLGALDAVLEGTYVSPTGMGIGLSGTKRLMDDFRCDTGPGGTTVRFAKRLDPRADLAQLAASIAEGLVTTPSGDPLDEVREQNHELLRALDGLRERETTLTQVNLELETTNRGVLALHAELDQRAEQLREASDIKSRFLSNMTHEFRTPLNSIIALSRLLLDHADGPLTEEQERQVSFIRKGAVGLAEMVDDLLDLAKIESGKTDIALDDFSLVDLFTSLRGMLKPLTAQNHAVLLAIEEPPDVRLVTDERKLAQIVRNFISNALKFTERGEVRVSARLIDDGMLAIAVADTGIGISDEQKKMLFTDYTQLPGALQKRSKGTGLGLSLSGRLAELLGGSVAVISTPGLGSTFTLSVPLRFAASPPAATDAAGKPTILHIEDDETFRYVLRSSLGPLSRLLVAADGETGLRLARSERPDALVLDLELPGLDGFGVYETLRSEAATRTLPVVVLSSYAPAAEDPRLAGCIAVIDKNHTDDPGRAVAAALRSAGLHLPER